MIINTKFSYRSLYNLCEEKEMIVKTLTLGNVIATNTYFYIDEKSKHGFLIDPADDADLLLQTIRRENWIIEKISRLLFSLSFYD